MATADQVLGELFIINQVSMYLVGFLMVVVVILVAKTPAVTFLKAFLTGKPIIAIKRKDGKYEGNLKHKYGIHQIDPEAVAREKKSGCDFHLGLDSIGVTLSDKLLQVLKVFQKGITNPDGKRYKFNTIDQIRGGMEYWRKCLNNGCTFEGIVNERIKEDMIGKTRDGKTKIRKTHILECPKCNGTKFERTLPELKFNRFNVYDPGFIDNYFLYNMNPSANEVITMREVQSQMQAEHKRQPILWISIAMSFAIIMMILMIVYSVMSKDTGGLQAAASGITNVNIPGLVG